MSSSAHPADGDLRALLDGEVSAAQRRDVEHHTGACDACRARLSALEAAAQETRALLDLLPPVAPALRSDTIVRRGRRAPLRWGAIAAGLTLVVATVAGATVGRPYVRALLARIRAAVGAPPAPSAPPAEPPVQRQAGIAFIPGPLVEIIFDGPQSTGVLRVSLADTSEIVIDPTASVTYRVHPGGVIVHNRGSDASYDIVVPRGAPHVRILMSGRVLFEKIGSGISATAPAESVGRYRITLH